MAKVVASFFKLVCNHKTKISYMPSEKYSKIADAVNYLHTNYLDNDFKVDLLEKMTDISPRYFKTLFGQQFGMSPKEYVISLLIKSAKELLMNEKNQVQDVAFMVGYSDVYHFSKLFKKKTGYTPTEYKREHRNELPQFVRTAQKRVPMA